LVKLNITITITITITVDIKAHRLKIAAQSQWSAFAYRQPKFMKDLNHELRITGLRIA